MYAVAGRQSKPIFDGKRAKVSIRAMRVSVDAELQDMFGVHINTSTVSGKRDFALCRSPRRAPIVEVTSEWGDIDELASGGLCVSLPGTRAARNEGVLNRMAYQAICTYLAADGRPAEG